MIALCETHVVWVEGELVELEGEEGVYEGEGVGLNRPLGPQREFPQLATAQRGALPPPTAAAFLDERSQKEYN